MRLDVDTVQDVALLRQVIHLQEAELVRLHARLSVLTQKLAQLQGTSESGALQLELLRLSEQLAALQHKMYGPSSEQRPHPAPTTEPEAKKPQTGHGPTPQPALPHVEQRHEISESERTCPLCQRTMAEFCGQTEDSEEITVIERRFVVTTHQRQKYRCACNAAILTAPGPLKLIEGGRYSLAFAVEVAVQKYEDHLPLDRQVRQMRRQGLGVTSQALWDQIYALSQVLLPAYHALGERVLSADLVQADETPWKLLQKAPTKTWYVWGLHSEYGTYYHLAPSRGQTVAKQLLGRYKGVLQTDGYVVYQTLARGSPDILPAYCWAHVRRGFFEARLAYPQCERVLELIAALYAVERSLPAYLHLPPAERAPLIALRTARRQAESAPLVAQILAWAEAQEALPQSSLRKAITYLQNLWPGLVRFVDDGRIPLDTNAMERQLRGVVVGRKNHYGSKTERGTQVAAVFYSLLETAQHVGIPAHVYLHKAAEHALQNPGAFLLPHSLLP